jgi:nicotinamide-nucleotide amidase
MNQHSALPTAAVLLTGNELLDGRTRDRNGAYLTADLSRRGLQVSHLLVTADDQAMIVASARWLLASRPAVLVVSGGLGTTHDDLTAAAIGEALGLSLTENPQALTWVADRTRLICARRGFVFDDVFATMRRQAVLPAGSRPLAPAGAAPGFVITRDDTEVVVLPGVPRELEPMWQAAAADLDRAGVFPGGELSIVRIYGVGELQVAPVLERALTNAAGLLRAGITAGDGEITVALRHDGGAAGARAAAEAGALLATELPVFSLDRGDIDTILADALRARHETVAVAESSTSGLLGEIGRASWRERV